MSHRPFYHNTTVVLDVNLIAKYASASAYIERKKKKMEQSCPILKSDVARNENGATPVLSLRHSIVVARLPVCRQYHAVQLNAGKRYQFL